MDTVFQPKLRYCILHDLRFLGIREDFRTWRDCLLAAVKGNKVEVKLEKDSTSDVEMVSIFSWGLFRDIVAFSMRSASSSA